MEPTCSICNRAIQNLPTTELLCHHVCHTFCFLTNIQVAQENLHFLSCIICERPVFGLVEEEHDENPPEDNEEPAFALENEEELLEEDNETASDGYSSDQDRVERLFMSNEEFRKDLKKYVQALRASSKPRQEFMKIVTTKKTELKPRYDQIKAMYEGLYQTKKDEIQSSIEYKNHKKSAARVLRYWYMFREKYHIRPGSLEYLKRKRGYRSIRRPHRFWRDSPQYAIRRALRLRLPWF